MQPRLLRVNAGLDKATLEPLPDEYIHHGGRELTSTLVANEVDAKADPLGDESKLVIATGMLAGTPAPNFSRISVGGKSPLTGGIKEANAGGKTGFLLGHHDIRAIVLEGSPARPFKNLIIDSEGNASLVDASGWEFTGNYETHSRLLEKHGKGSGVISIGPAGARRYNMASIAVTDLQGYPSRHAARGGLGAVMGAKGIKAIVVERAKASRITYADKEAFLSIAGPWSKQLKQAKAGFSKLGTALTVGISQTLRGLPTRNFSRGVFDGADKIGGDHLHEIIVARGGRFGIPCLPGCAIQCSNYIIGPGGTHLTSSLEYETIALNGSNLLIDDLDVIGKIDHECDDAGIDTIEFGATAGVLMEAGKIDFGDGDAVLGVLDDIKQGKGDGELFSRGAARVGKELGVDRIPAVKGQGFPAYDPRVYKGMGITYITSPMGADHTAGAAIYKRPGFDPDKDHGDVFEKGGKKQLSFELQVLNGACDMLGACYFIGPSLDTVEKAVALLQAKAGWDASADLLLEKTRQFLRVELAFNERAGVGFRPNAMPRFIKEEASEPSGFSWEFTDEDLDGFWSGLEKDH